MHGYRKDRMLQCFAVIMIANILLYLEYVNVCPSHSRSCGAEQNLLALISIVADDHDNAILMMKMLKMMDSYRLDVEGTPVIIFIVSSPLFP